MPLEFTLDIIEQKKDRLFVTGLALTEIAVQDEFSQLVQYGSKQKSRKQLASLNLIVETIIVDGEPVESVSANQPAMIVLSGNFDSIESEATNLRWRKKSGRIIRTGDLALTLSSSDN